MKKLFIICLIFPSFCLGQKNNNWLKNYWLSSNVSIIYSVENVGTAVAADVGRSFKKGFKIGAGYNFLQFDKATQLDVVHVYLEKSIDTKSRALFFLLFFLRELYA